MNNPLPPRSGGPTFGGKQLADLALRLVSAVVMISAALGTLYYPDGGQVFLLFWLLVAVLVHWEWQHMTGGRLLLLRCLAGTAALAGAAALSRGGDYDLPLLALIAGALVLVAIAGSGHRRWAALGVFYAGGLIIALCMLRFSNPGIFRRMVVLWLFAIVWGTDVMAYFGGRLIGGPKLWVRVSPSKTWSGTLFGIMSGALLGVAVVWWLGLPEANISLGATFTLGLVIASAAQVGDMMESAMKRHFGVKDSSHLIPGHGGFMDRLDGFIAASVLAAVIGTLRFGPGLAVNGLFQW